MSSQNSLRHRPIGRQACGANEEQKNSGQRGTVGRAQLPGQETEMTEPTEPHNGGTQVGINRADRPTKFEMKEVEKVTWSSRLRNRTRPPYV